MTSMTPAEYWDEANHLIDQARRRFADGDHSAVSALCALAQAHFCAAATRTAITYAEMEATPAYSVEPTRPAGAVAADEPEAVIDPGEGMLT
jgi:hypothetical protein